MQKVVEEDWSFFNQAVRDRARRKPRSEEVADDKIKPFPDRSGVSAASEQRTAPPPGSAQRPPHTINPMSAAPKPPPISEDRMVRYVLRFLLLVVAAMVVYAFFAGAFRMDASRPAIVTGTGTEVVTGTGTGGTGTVVTNYTQFNTVESGEWHVVTGWNFTRSGDTLPVNQYCYIEKRNDGGGTSRFDLENRIASGARLPNKQPDALVPGLTDEVWAQAAAKCRWHH